MPFGIIPESRSPSDGFPKLGLLMAEAIVASGTNLTQSTPGQVLATGFPAEPAKAVAYVAEVGIPFFL
jgi:hypothetical protein